MTIKSEIFFFLFLPKFPAVQFSFGRSSIFCPGLCVRYDIIYQRDDWQMYHGNLSNMSAERRNIGTFLKLRVISQRTSGRQIPGSKKSPRILMPKIPAHNQNYIRVDCIRSMSNYSGECLQTNHTLLLFFIFTHGITLTDIVRRIVGLII